MEPAKEVKEQFKEAKSNITIGGNRPMNKVENEVTSMASDLATKFTDISSDLVKDSVSFVKQYPLHTALGALAVGFAVGMFARPSRSKAK